MLFDP